ncbi:MAG: phosphate acyltransferase PlsX, partial [Alphaproteobacteria bacterium]
MSGNITIALDAMGGDHAPRSVLKGANIARRRWPDVRFLLVGNQVKLKPLLKRMPRLKKVCELLHTDTAVAADEKPAIALRSGRQSSMRLAIDAVRDGNAEGVVSAGNTGALMAMSKFSLKTIVGIDRPAMASFYPTLRGESVMLDLGANIQCSSTNLVQFAVMGEVFARTVLGSLKPSVGLLNVGSEDLKGNDTVRDAAAILKEFGPEFNFHGFVEGNDIAEGTVDVVVADGFSGNISIKTAEGTAKLYTHFLRDAFRSSVLAGIGYLL